MRDSSRGNCRCVRGLGLRLCEGLYQAARTLTALKQRQKCWCMTAADGKRPQLQQQNSCCWSMEQEGCSPHAAATKRLLRLRCSARAAAEKLLQDSCRCGSCSRRGQLQ